MFRNVFRPTLVGLALFCFCPALFGQPPRSKKVEILAYINQRWGCQKPTENFLAELVRKYGKRVSLEIVDFGGNGRKRWRDDGMHCMAIKLNGTTAVEIVQKGVEVPVRFEMPVGYRWTHEELATAVRQILDGVSAADRRPPEVGVRKGKDGTGLLIDGHPVLKLRDGERIAEAAKVLKAASAKPLASEDFNLEMQSGGAAVMVRGNTMLKIMPEDAKSAAKTVPELGKEWLKAMTEPYPVLTRPFPGKTHVRRRPQGR